MNMGLPQYIISTMSDEGFWESKMGQMIEHSIIEHMSQNEFLYVGYMDGYFTGFDCISVIKYLYMKINEREGDKNRKIKNKK